MELRPKLVDVAVPERPRGAVLVLHGGASRRDRMAVSPTQLSVLRMVPIARRIARDGAEQLAVFRLLNSRRGWDTHHTPVDDARWALDRLAERLGPEVPVCLVGHSLGGRAALLTAGAPAVASAVALAPWVYASDVPDGLDGERILVVHGTRDRVASPARAAALVRNIDGRARIGHVSVRDAHHAMLRRHDVFSGLASAWAAATLLDRPPGPPLDRLLDGAAAIEV